MPNLSWFKELTKFVKKIIIRDNKNKIKSGSSVNVSNDKISKDEIAYEVLERRQTNQFVPESVSDKNEISDENLEKFVKRLGIDQFPLIANFAGENFEWPVTMKVPECRVIINHIIRYDEEIGKELATNAIAFRRLYETNKIDSTKGSYVLIVNGKIKWYEKEFSWDKYREFEEKYPGKYFVPTVEKPIVLRRFEALDDKRNKAWRVNIWLRGDEIIDVRSSMVIDSGSAVTAIPNNIREQLHNPNANWAKECKYASGYADGEPIYQGSRPWELRIGDGRKWTDWFKTDEIYSWQQDSDNDGLVGYDVLDNISHFKLINQTLYLSQEQ